MKTKFLFMVAMGLAAVNGHAQAQSEMEVLKSQLKEATDNFQKTIEQHRLIIESLNKRLDAMQQQQTAVTNEQQKLKQLLAPSVAQTTPPVLAPVPSKPWSPSDPIRVAGGGQSYLNMSFVALVAAGGSTARDIESLQLGGHDPKQRGFTVQNLETTFEGKVDPYFRGQANIVMQIDPRGETIIEAEEAYLETAALPWNLQLKAGQFFTEFGRLNPQHPHTWSFVDQPLVNGRFFGGDGLRNPGARLSWLMPTPFYAELYLAVQNSHGETAHSFRSDHEGELFLGRPAAQGTFKAFNSLLLAPRYAMSFDLSDSQTLVAGLSGAFGPNGSGPDTRTEIYGADLFWKWKPVNHHAGFPFVSWQTEGLVRRSTVGAFSNAGDDLQPNGVIDNGENDVFGDGSVRTLGRERLTDYGGYSQLSWGFRKGWVAALRGDYVTHDKLAAYESAFGADPNRATRWRVSPNLTWFPSEFSKIRLQYNYDRRQGLGSDHSVWLQFEFLLGAHGAHKF